MESKNTLPRVTAKNKLIHSALKLLQKKQPSQLNYREIAAGAGLSHMTAYRHFKTIDDLLEAVAIEGYERLSLEFNSLVNQYSKKPEQLLEEAIFSYFEFAKNYPHHLTAMFDRGDQKGQFKKKAFMDAVNKLHKEYLEVILVCQNAGLFPKNLSPVDLGLMLWSFSHGYATLETKTDLKLTMAHRSDPKSFVKKIVQVLVAGLKQ